jgi:hypothetical protein
VIVKLKVYCRWLRYCESVVSLLHALTSLAPLLNCLEELQTEVYTNITMYIYQAT